MDYDNPDGSEPDEDFVEGDIDDDDDEDEEESSDEGEKRRKRRKKRDARDSLILMEAEEDEEGDDDEDEMGEDEEEAGLGEDLGPEEDAGRNDRNLFRQLQTNDVTEEELVRQVAERYKNYGQTVDETELEGTDLDIARQSMLPVVGKDPSLFQIKCRAGREKEIVLALMNKALSLAGTDHPLLITSAIASDHLKGYFYVEAQRDAHIMVAIDNIPNIFRSHIKRVTVKEMPDVLHVPTKTYGLKRGDWVRVKRGIYRGDLAQIYEFDEGSGRAVIKLIPRLDIPGYFRKKAEREAENEALEAEGKKRKRAPPMRSTGPAPPPVFFNDEEVRARDPEAVGERHDTRTGLHFLVFDNQRFLDGFMYKQVKVITLSTEGIQPTFDELQRFQAGLKKKDGTSSAADDIATLKQLTSKTKAKPRRLLFQKGDTVRVSSGESVGIIGIISAMDEKTVTIIPKTKGDSVKISSVLVPLEVIEKFFEVGDHIKVLTGRYEGETGLITKLDDGVATIFSDTTKKELKVLTSEIQEATEIATSGLRLGNYELYDLVQIGQSQGVIVRVEREGFHILEPNDNVRYVRLQELGSKRSSFGSLVMDRNNIPIKAGDSARIVFGRHKGLSGSVKHIARSHVYILCRDIQENGGLVVARRSDIEGTNFQRDADKKESMENRGNNGYGGGPQSGRPQMVGRGRLRRDELVSRTVGISRGRYKGYVGIVKEANPDQVRVELHTLSKIISLPRNDVYEVDEHTGQPKKPLESRSGDKQQDFHDDYGYGAPATPMPPQTPSHWSSGRPMTPSHASSAWNPSYEPKTPVHRPPSPEHSRAPVHDPWSAAPTTPAADYYSNSRPTPSSSSYREPSYTPRDSYPSAPTPGGDRRTPAVPATPGFNAYDYDAQTPAPRTPGAYMYNNAPTTPGGVPQTPGGAIHPTTPGGIVPQTPGGVYNTPYSPGAPATPGGISIPPATPGGAYGVPATPGGAYIPHTPGGYPNTPGGPQTPGGYNPTTPHPGDSAADDPDAWHIPDIMVVVKSSGKSGSIKSVGDSDCVVQVGGELLTVAKDAIKPVVPEKRDRVYILSGEYKGRAGSLTSITASASKTGSDGIVKLDNLDITVVDMGSIAKAAV